MTKSEALKVMAEIADHTPFHGFLVRSEYAPDSYAVAVSAEDSASDDSVAADYYELGDPWINPILEKLAKARGEYWQWRDPGCIELWD